LYTNSRNAKLVIGPGATTLVFNDKKCKEVFKFSSASFN